MYNFFPFLGDVAFFCLFFVAVFAIDAHVNKFTKLAKLTYYTTNSEKLNVKARKKYILNYMYKAPSSRAPNKHLYE